ncbi:Immunity protein SdpI [Aquisphaera giovannonii]|uniref:Immunity protein SdpI n=1 Tax=Aquisphaera giovannonii TaxID=406548 RepID=A0A5B9W8E3_9BACT|nr:DUF1648 domain-containing protein [Aquisphaera giovannonii]QEH36878.1 Immunity protein SdpI [Aquisphaera giovannonii]
MNRGYWIVAAALVLASWTLAAWAYPGLPRQVPIHWNIEGKVDGWGDKTWATFLAPALMTGFLVFFALLPALSPKSFEVESFRPTYLYCMVVTLGLFAYMNAVILLATKQELQPGGWRIDIGRALIAGLFLFFALLGNVMGKVRKNFYIGFRVPWTLASDRVWNDTHRLAAWLMTGGGVVGFLAVVMGASLYVAFSVLLITTLVPLVYSFVHYKSLERKGLI